MAELTGERRQKGATQASGADESRSVSRAAASAYRADIDGLRAVSVLAVLFFHAGLPLFPGGFIGVDVFFVISGYLITSLLVSEHGRNGRISIVAFWARRVRRLAPALIFVLASVLACSAFLLERITGEIGSVTRAALATLLLNANHFFLAQSGNYFGALAETNPLLHMWSLSVEEQFYFVWPLTVALLLTFTRHTRTLVVAALVLCSLIVACYWAVTYTSRGFYLMPARAWELLAGALLAFGISGRQPFRPAIASGAAFIGLVLVVGSAMLLSGERYFPGPLAAFPVVGAVLLIAGGATNAHNHVTRVLGSSLMAYVGKISYPLYLWHWPLLVISRSRRLYEPSLALDLLTLIVSVALAIFTYEIVERRSWTLLQRYRPSRTIQVGMIASTAVACAALIIGAWARYGWGYSDTEKLLEAARRDLPSMQCLFKGYPRSAVLDTCFPSADRPAVLLWGDSHANHWRPALAGAADELGITLGVLAMRDCRPLPGLAADPGCVDFNENLARSIAEWKRSRRLAGIVVSARWPQGTGTLVPSISDRAREQPQQYLDARARSQAEALSYLRQSLQTLVRLADEHELRVLVVLSSPVQRFAATHCLAVKPEADCYVGVDQLSAYAGPAEEVIRQVALEAPNLRVFDPKVFMCAEGRCPAVLDGLTVYSDDDHITARYARLNAQRFSGELRWLVAGGRGHNIPETPGAAPVAASRDADARGTGKRHAPP